MTATTAAPRPIRPVLAVCLLISIVSGCDSGITQGFGDLLSIRDGVAEIAEAPNVAVHLHNDVALTIMVTNSGLNTQSSEQRRSAADRIARLAYEKYSKRARLDAIKVVFSSHTRKFLVVNITSTIDSYRFSGEKLSSLSRIFRNLE